MPSWLCACWAKMSRISATRSTTSHGEDLLEVALLRGRQLVVEHDEIDVERVGGLAQLLGLARADVGRGVGRVAALQLHVDGIGARGVGEQRELVERRLRGFGVTRADARADEQRPLPDDREVDLGRGEPPSGRRAERRVAHRAGRGSRALHELVEVDLDVEDVRTGPPRRTVSPSSTRRSPPGTWTVTSSRRARVGGRPRRPRTRRCRSSASRRRHAPTRAW